MPLIVADKSEAATTPLGTPFQVFDGNVYASWSRIAPFTSIDGTHHPTYRNGLIAIVYEKELAPVFAAAPDLLAACEQAYDWLADHGGNLPPSGIELSMQLRDAIAKTKAAS